MFGFLRERLEQDREVTSEDLQEEKNESESQKRRYNLLIILKLTNASSAKSANPNLAITAGQILALLLQRQ